MKIDLQIISQLWQSACGWNISRQEKYGLSSMLNTTDVGELAQGNMAPVPKALP